MHYLLLWSVFYTAQTCREIRRLTRSDSSPLGCARKEEKDQLYCCFHRFAKIFGTKAVNFSHCAKVQWVHTNVWSLKIGHRAEKWDKKDSWREKLSYSTTVSVPKKSKFHPITCHEGISVRLNSFFNPLAPELFF